MHHKKTSVLWELSPLGILSLFIQFSSSYLSACGSFCMDRGVLAVVKVTVPLHQCLARFWRYFKIEPSLVQSSVSIFILSLMELISTSLKLLHYTTWHSLSRKDTNGRSFYYDAKHVVLWLASFILWSLCSSYSISFRRSSNVFSTLLSLLVVPSLPSVL